MIVRSVGVLATFRIVHRDGLYPRLFLREFDFDGVLWPFCISACQSVNDDAYWPPEATQGA